MISLLKTLVLLNYQINLKKNQKGTYLQNLEPKKIEHTYIEPQVQDAETIETETKNKDDEFNEIENAATEQKQQNEIIDFIHDVIDENNPFNDTETDDIYIEDVLFDNNNATDIKDTATNIIETINLDDDIDIPSGDG